MGADEIACLDGLDESRESSEHKAGLASILNIIFRSDEYQERMLDSVEIPIPQQHVSL
jgi:hypothetical protein